MKVHPEERAVERAIDKDRMWFSKRPHRRFRLRRSVRGEFEILEVGRGLTGTMTDRLQMQAQAATTEQSAYDHCDGADRLVVTLVEQVKPGARLRHCLVLPKTIFDQRHQLTEEDYRVWRDTGMLPLDALSRQSPG